jgi:hypothetical protein
MGDDVSESVVRIGSVRRTQRVTIAIPVAVRGTGFQETTSAVSVSGNGGLVMLKTTVALDELVSLMNPQTREESSAKVVYLGKPEDGRIPVGLEFSEPSPLFWKIYFPPGHPQTSSETQKTGIQFPTKIELGKTIHRCKMSLVPSASKEGSSVASDV